MTWNDRKRVVTNFNFLSFIYIDVKGFSFKFGQTIFTGLEMLQLESWSISFFVLLCSEILEKCRSVTFMIWHFEASEYFLTKFEWEALDININEWQKVEVCCFPFSIISSHFKNGIYVLSLYWRMNTYAYQFSTSTSCMSRLKSAIYYTALISL